MKIAIIINVERLTPELDKALRDTDLAKKYDIHADLFILEPCDFAARLDEMKWQSYNACLVGGGDGTVNLVINKLKDVDIPLVILPLGTFNILAKSLDYPNDLEAIYEMIKNNKIREIDLAAVNGKTFVNHAWLGSYYYILKLRKKHKSTVGRSRLLKLIFNTFWMFKNIPIYEFKIKVGDEERLYKTCLVFISNNESNFELFNFGLRPLLSTGQLHVNILNCYTRWQLFSCLINTLIWGMKPSRYIQQFKVSELSVTSRYPEAEVVLDGELVKLKNPLHFVNLKHFVKVISP